MLADAWKVVFSMGAMQSAALSSWALDQLALENIGVVGMHSGDIGGSAPVLQPRSHQLGYRESILVQKEVRW